jgi:hypothetical protein
MRFRGPQMKAVELEEQATLHSCCLEANNTFCLRVRKRYRRVNWGHGGRSTGLGGGIMLL